MINWGLALGSLLILFVIFVGFCREIDMILSNRFESLFCDLLYLEFIYYVNRDFSMIYKELNFGFILNRISEKLLM